jgi:hypothetical protein
MLQRTNPTRRAFGDHPINRQGCWPHDTNAVSAEIKGHLMLVNFGSLRDVTIRHEIVSQDS